MCVFLRPEYFYDTGVESTLPGQFVRLYAYSPQNFLSCITLGVSAKTTAASLP